MLAIAPVPASPPGNPYLAHARALFILYGDFLRASLACGSFNFAKYDEEIAALPTLYSSHGGDVLLALEDGAPAACIAFRAFPSDPTGATGEIKRLFVHPAFRARGLARLLIAEAIGQAAARGFTRIALDTDSVAMPAALALYQMFGFTEYAPRLGNIAFLERDLVSAPWLPASKP